MNKENLSRLTADIPKKYHLKLKSVALLTGKTIREVLIDVIESINLECIESSHIPNAETIKIFEEIEKGKNLAGKEKGGEFLKNLISKC